MSIQDFDQEKKLYEEILTKEEGLQKTANNLIYVGQPLEFDEVHFLSELKKLEIAASEESRDVKKNRIRNCSDVSYQRRR